MLFENPLIATKKLQTLNSSFNMAEIGTQTQQFIQEIATSLQSEEKLKDKRAKLKRTTSLQLEDGEMHLSPNSTRTLSFQFMDNFSQTRPLPNKKDSVEIWWYYSWSEIGCQTAEVMTRTRKTQTEIDANLMTKIESQAEQAIYLNEKV